MLKKLKELRLSLNAEQDGVLHSALPEGIVERFFASEDEAAATSVVADMNEYFGTRPMEAFALYKKLSPEQRAMISDLVFDDDEDDE